MKITASDGESRFIQGGEILLVEDTHGKGHLSDHIEKQDPPLALHPDRIARSVIATSIARKQSR